MDARKPLSVARLPWLNRLQAHSANRIDVGSFFHGALGGGDGVPLCRRRPLFSGPYVAAILISFGFTAPTLGSRTVRTPSP